MKTINKSAKEGKVYEVLTRYGVMDRRVAVTAKGVMVYVPAECLNERYDDMYGDIKHELNDESDVVIFHTKDALTVNEFIKKNMAILKEGGWI